MVRATSRAAFRNLERKRKIQEAFTLLDGCRRFHDRAPTGQELEAYAAVQGYRRFGDVHKRLSELVKLNLAHEGPKRACLVTGELVLTWVPGPDPKRKSPPDALPPVQAALLHRLRLLRRCVTDSAKCPLTALNAAIILDARRQIVKALWDA